MKHSTMRCIGILFLMTGLALLPGPSVWALTPLSDDALGETVAATGVRFTLEDLVISHNADLLRFEAHENENSLGYQSPSPPDNDSPYNSLGLGSLSTTLSLDGTVELAATPFQFESQPYYATDVWKKDDLHVSKDHTLDKAPQFNNAGRQVVVVDMAGTGDAPFLQVGKYEVQEDSDGIPAMIEEKGMQGTLRVTYEGETKELGNLSVSGLKLIDQRAILYAMPEIPYDVSNPGGKLYCSGGGIAMELGLRLSIGKVAMGSVGSPDLTFLTMTGIHLRESFGPLATDYDHLGKFTKNTGDIYADSTMDPGGYDGTAHGVDLGGAYTDITADWESLSPLSAQPVDNMYGGRFMIGNLRQVEYYDYVAGNNDISPHSDHTNQLAKELKDNGMDDQEHDFWGAHYVDDEDRVDYSEIVERPMTLSLKKRTRDESPDESSCLAINMPLHGSIRVEEVKGYNLEASDSDYQGWSPSMGPLIVEGLRVKKLYIEFPGRNTTYTLETAVNESVSDPNTYLYTYRSGKLPVAQELPAGQKDYNPMGRGVEEFMNRLRPEPGPWDEENQCIVPAPVNSGWAQYRTRIGDNIYDGDRLVKDNSFWQIREPYPINSNYKLYRNPVN